MGDYTFIYMKNGSNNEEYKKAEDFYEDLDNCIIEHLKYIKKNNGAVFEIIYKKTRIYHINIRYSQCDSVFKISKYKYYFD